MCGIIAILGEHVSRKHALKPLNRRGPDEKGAYISSDVYLGHTRLSIVNPESGPQPIRYKEWVLVINGELYNATTRTADETDCHLLIHLLEEHGADAIAHVDGIFAFVAYHVPTKRVIVARDAIGVMPLYWAMSDTGHIFSSLLMSLHTGEARPVEPGTVADFHVGDVPVFQKWAAPYVRKGPYRNRITGIIILMHAAVSKRLMGDVPWGVLLSGGLDSTIVASLAAAMAAERRPDYPRVHSFCIGLEGSPDIVAAEQVALELNTHHTTIRYTLQEGLQAVRSVIRAIETYDVTTVRASVPMWLLGKAIRKRGIKMLLSGEGSDELFAGYLYNLYCPSVEEMEAECKRKMDQLWAYDCLRANKTMGDWGIETRVPFLDSAVVDFAMNRLDPVHKMSGTHPDGPRAEKWWLREQFRGIAPDCVLNRTKAQFSDAVGSEWIDGLQAAANQKVPDELFAQAAARFPHQTPDTKEAFWYRSIFEELFAHVSDAEKTVLYQPSIACSTGVAARWHENFSGHLDPSGNAIHRAFQFS